MVDEGQRGGHQTRAQAAHEGRALADGAKRPALLCIELVGGLDQVEGVLPARLRDRRGPGYLS